MHKIQCNWDENMKFTALDEFGNSMTMDLAKEAGGDNLGFRPMPMLLVGLGGCMGVDVKIILEKMKIEFSSIDLDIIGELDESVTPRTYKKISVIFKFKGKNLEHEKLMKAIKLAEEKYCNVSAMLSKICVLDYSAEIIEEV
jgi:putative redox protein